MSSNISAPSLREASKKVAPTSKPRRHPVPEFYVVSVNGVTYLVAAHSRMEAVSLLAVAVELGTDAADWTLLSDSMLAEIRIGASRGYGGTNREACLALCENQRGYLGEVEIV